MDRKTCRMCNTEKIIEKFYNKYIECKICTSKRYLKQYYQNKDKLPKQRKTFYEKNRDVLPSNSKLNHQNGKAEGKIYKQQREELNKKLEDLTQTI